MKRKRYLFVVFVLLSLLMVVGVLPRFFSPKDVTFAQSKSLTPDVSQPTYYGGPVMAGVMHVYAIYWFPNDNGANNAYINAINQYYTDVGGSRLYNILAEYAGNNGSIVSATLADSWEDMNTPYPCQQPCSLTFQNIENEVQHAISTNHWPTSGYTNYFPVYTLQGIQIADPQGDGACGVHWFWGPLDNPTIFAHLAFPSSQGQGSNLSGCNVNVPTAPSGSPYIDSAINASAHEQIEAATDPVGIRTLSWYVLSGGEIADVCYTDFGPTPYPYDGGLANQEWNGHFYIIQTIDSRSPAGCLLGP